jgi:APA family basic amino acid/polyamine antiporter
MADERRYNVQGFTRKLSDFFDATMLIAGTMIGSGIFIVSADVARDVGLRVAARPYG